MQSTLFVAASLAAVVTFSQVDRMPAPKGKHEEVVRGCLNGKDLKAEGNGSPTYRLRIPKSLTKALKEVNGHEAELTGYVKDTDRAMGGAYKLGSKTTLRVGGHDDSLDASENDVRDMDVASFRDLDHVCRS